MLLLLLLSLDVVTSNRPRFECPWEFEHDKCWDRGNYREIRTIENLKSHRQKISAECFDDDSGDCFYDRPVRRGCSPYCLGNIRIRLVKMLADALPIYTQKYKSHGEAVFEECWKYAVGPYLKNLTESVIYHDCPNLVDGLQLNFNSSTAELVQIIRKKLNIVPENLKAPAKRLHRIISEYYVSKNECDLSGINKLFFDNEKPLYFMGKSWCKPGIRPFPNSAYNRSVVEHVKDSSLFYTLRGLSTTDHFLMENDWDISFSQDNVTATVPWRFRRGDSSIDCDFIVTYRLLDFFEKNPKLRNVVRLLCPYGRFDHAAVCDSLSKIPNWAAPFIYEVTEEETKKAYREYKEMESRKEGNVWPRGLMDSYSYFNWKTFEFPRLY